MKALVFVGGALRDLKDFPGSARRKAGYQLFRVQCGDEPSDWKPMSSIGPGAYEIRIRDRAGAFRVIYVANIGPSVHVLHAFEKKTARTDRLDVAIARDRLKTVGG